MNGGTILVDNNALADFFVGKEDFKRDAEKLRRKFPDWVAPPLIRYEFGNVLRTYVRCGYISQDDGMEMLRLGLSMVRFCEECAEEVILEEANASSLTFYDATYSSCARRQGYELFTRDGDILRSCPEFARSILSV
ncbi:MAG: type II toxin-antitoxin system VapC family toxin [Luteolibacter sp.]